MNRKLIVGMLIAGIFSTSAVADDKEGIRAGITEYLIGLGCIAWKNPDQSHVIQRTADAPGGSYDIFSEAYKTGLIAKSTPGEALPEKAAFQVGRDEKTRDEFIAAKPKNPVLYTLEPAGRELYDKRCSGIRVGNVKAEAFLGLTPPLATGPKMQPTSFARLKLKLESVKEDYKKPWLEAFKMHAEQTVVLAVAKQDGNAWRVVGVERID